MKPASREADSMLRFPLLILAMGGLITGLWGGLLRAGAGLPLPSPVMPGMHGPIMIGGFLGTLIALERAVALGRTWAFLAPVLAASGGIAMFIAPAQVAAPWLLTAAAAVLCLMFVRIYRMQPADFLLVMALGAVAWLVGNLLWATGYPLFVVVWWWMMFLVLTISGERLELSRMLGHDRRVMRPFFLLTCVATLGMLLTPILTDAGIRILALAMIGFGLWMLRFDIARHTIRAQGLTKYIAVCLLAGYVWLIAGGILSLVHGFQAAGPAYDAMLHAVFVGFVFSMIFGHAPIIFPSVLGLQVGYTPWLYLHLGVLHAGLLLRVVADIVGWMPGRMIGSWMSAVAIVLFLITMAATLVAARFRFRRETGLPVN